MSAVSAARQVMAAFADAAGRVMPTEVRGVESPVGVTPYTVVARRGPMSLLAFEPRGERRFKTPVVFSYSLINRWYVLDFAAGRSLIEALTGLGHPCYVVDWGVPGPADRHLTWGDYALRLLRFALKTACDREGVPAAHLYGYCMGGTLALTHAILRPERVKTFTAMAVPIDFHEGGLLSTWTKPKHFDVDSLVDAFGNVPTWLMEAGFRSMAPMTNVLKWRDLWENREKDGFVDVFRAMERWSADNVPFPGEVYRQYIRDTYQENRLVAGQMSVEGERVALENLKAPLLLVTAQKDHIVPRKASLPLFEKAGSEDKRHLEFPTGHIGLSTSARAPKDFWPVISEWLADHD